MEGEPTENRQEFEQRMTKTYPLLYSDMYGDPRHTCMAFGFDIGPGWYPMLEEMSAKLEPLIREEYAKSMLTQTECSFCCRPKKWHWLFFIINTVKYFFLNKWIAIKKMPREIKRSRCLNINPWDSVKWLLFKSKHYKACKKFRYSCPQATQVKEKFAGLRFYMTWETDEIDKIIGEYEEKSYTICETCGQPGKVRRDKAWIVTLCDKCNKPPHPANNIEKK